MFIENAHRSYDDDGAQESGPARFLIIVQSKDRDLGPDNFRGIVRTVKLHQCGHFMMGNVTLAGQTITLSGTYGNDGLPKTVDEEVYAKGVDIPRHLYDAWNTGGGWNSAGSEAQALRHWALNTCKIFKRFGEEDDTE